MSAGPEGSFSDIEISIRGGPKLFELIELFQVVDFVERVSFFHAINSLNPSLKISIRRTKMTFSRSFLWILENLWKILEESFWSIDCLSHIDETNFVADLEIENQSAYMYSESAIQRLWIHLRIFFFGSRIPVVVVDVITRIQTHWIIDRLSQSHLSCVTALVGAGRGDTSMWLAYTL